jgi:hypothetical protein
MPTSMDDVFGAYDAWKEIVSESPDRASSWGFCLRVIRALTLPIYDNQGSPDRCLNRVVEVAVCLNAFAYDIR